MWNPSNVYVWGNAREALALSIQLTWDTQAHIKSSKNMIDYRIMQSNDWHTKRASSPTLSCYGSSATHTDESKDDW